MGTTEEKQEPVPLTVGASVAAIILGVGRSHIYNLINKGELPAIVLGDRKVIPLAVLRRMFDAAMADVSKAIETEEDSPSIIRFDDDIEVRKRAK